jgi:hypothetical protein
MTAPTRANRELRQRISDELRQLKLMSKGLRSKATRDRLERHANQRLKAEPAPLPTKPPSPVAVLPPPSAKMPPTKVA